MDNINIAVNYSVLEEYMQKCSEINNQIDLINTTIERIDDKLTGMSDSCVYYGLAHDEFRQYFINLKVNYMNELSKCMKLCSKYIDAVYKLSYEEDEAIKNVFNSNTCN